MRIFALADLHLSKAQPKPMNVFGGNWEGHPEIIFERWRETVADNDLVLIPGDISWAMNLAEASHDLQDIADLPGKKVLLRGNHDYWWSAIGKLRQSLPEGMYALQNDAVRFGDLVIAGARGWNCPGSYDFGEQDMKIYMREVSRLQLSLEAAQKLEPKKLIVMMHFPPTNPKLEPSGFTELLLKARPDILVFGHVHGETKAMPVPVLENTKVHFVAADALEFYPKQIC